MKLVTPRLVPILIAGLVLVLVCLCQAFRLELFQRLEWITYDWRVREAVKFSPPVAENLGFVAIDDDSIEWLQNGWVDGKSYGLLWPRQIYGRLVRELKTQGAKAIGFDILFSEARSDQPPFVQADGTNSIEVPSDQFFADQLGPAGNVILAADKGLTPIPAFMKRALAVADISTKADPDGVLRRIRPFADYLVWNPLFTEIAATRGLKVSEQRDRVTFSDPITREAALELPVDRDGNFRWEDLTGKKTKGFVRLEPAYQKLRAWHMGIVLAARELGLDLANAVVDSANHRIVLTGTNGVPRVQRTIPLDDDGTFLINWTIPVSDRRLTKETIQSLLIQDQMRAAGDTKGVKNRFHNKLVVVGSAAVGSNLTDLGATSLTNRTLYVSTHWNVVNSLLQHQFIRQFSYWTELGLIVVLGAASGYLTWRLRAVRASACVLAMAAIYVGVGLDLFVQHRYWLPLVLPVLGSLLMTHVCMVTWRAIFEQNERRRVKSVFAKIVSPNVVNELLGAEKLSLGGARRRISVFFADVRGFTQMTDDNQLKAVQYARDHQLTGDAAEAHYDASARQTLETVNLYLAIIADTIKKHNGTLDKYIGDCVMAFWGAPTPNAQHALACVRAAVDAQRAMHAVNQERFAENQRREKENQTRAAAGQPPLPLLPLLSLGTGINTGEVIVGLMGSDAHILNYTVFGREVNLASRLEGVSGRGRVIIGEATYEEIKRDDPALAATCLEQPPVMVKGITQAVKIYEVPWKQSAPPSPAAPAKPESASSTQSGDTTRLRPVTPPATAKA